MCDMNKILYPSTIEMDSMQLTKRYTYSPKTSNSLEHFAKKKKKLKKGHNSHNNWRISPQIEADIYL